MKNALKNILRKPYFIFLLILLAGMLSVWIYLWVGLAAYEAGLPKNLMSQLVDDLSFYAEEGNSEKIIAKYNDPLTIEPYEDQGTVLGNLTKGKTLKYSKTIGLKSDNALYYSIFADGEEVARATLSQNEKSGILGLSVYEISEFAGTKGLTILSHADATVYLKGVEVNFSDVKNNKIIPRELQKLYNYSQNQIEIPTYDEYFISGLFSMPSLQEVEVVFSDGSKAESVWIQEDYILTSRPASTTLIEETTEWITAATKKYSYYMSDDLEWIGFKNYLVKTSPIYDRLRTLEVGWYTLHDSTRFDNMEVSDFFVFSDKLISLRLTYDYVVVGQGKVTTYDTDLTYFLAIDTDGQWRIAEMIVN